MIDMDKIIDALKTWQKALMQNDEKARQIASWSLLNCAETK